MADPRDVSLVPGLGSVLALVTALDATHEVGRVRTKLVITAAAVAGAIVLAILVRAYLATDAWPPQPSFAVGSVIRTPERLERVKRRRRW